MFQTLVVVLALVAQAQVEDAPIEAPRPEPTVASVLDMLDLHAQTGQNADDASRDHFGSAEDPVEAPEPMWFWMEKWERARAQRKLLEMDPEVPEARRDLDTRVDASTDWEVVGLGQESKIDPPPVKTPLSHPEQNTARYVDSLFAYMKYLMVGNGVLLALFLCHWRLEKRWSHGREYWWRLFLRERLGKLASYLICVWGVVLLVILGLTLFSLLGPDLIKILFLSTIGLIATLGIFGPLLIRNSI